MTIKTKEELWNLFHKDYCKEMNIPFVIDDMNNMDDYHSVYLIGVNDGKENEGNANG